MLRKIKNSDHMWVNTNDICNVVQFLHLKGATVDMVMAKRAYTKKSEMPAEVAPSEGEEGEGACASAPMQAEGEQCEGEGPQDTPM